MSPWSESLSGLAVWPGLFLLAGGLAKAREARADTVDGKTLLFRALPDAVPPRPVWAGVAGAELAVGGLVLAGVARPYPQVAAGVGLAGAAALAAWGVRVVPEAGCGCFGAQSEPVTARTVARAGALAALALAGAAGGEAWTAAFSGAARGGVTRGGATRGSATRGSATRGSATRGSAARGGTTRGGAARGSAASAALRSAGGGATPGRGRKWSRNVAQQRSVTTRRAADGAARLARRTGTPATARGPADAGAARRAVTTAATRGALRRSFSAAVVLGAGAALAAASPELRRPRHLRARAHDVVCAHRPAPARDTLERLQQSPLWADSRPYLQADAPSEQWRDGCWRYVSYPANYEGEAATAVFALYLGKSRNADGVAFVADDEQRVLGQIKGRK